MPGPPNTLHTDCVSAYASDKAHGLQGLNIPAKAHTQTLLTLACPAGMALATLFVTLPFVVRELIPVLEQMDLAEEEAARTLGATDWEVFWEVTLPNIKWGLLYGIILTNAVRPVR